MINYLIIKRNSITKSKFEPMEFIIIHNSKGSEKYEEPLLAVFNNRSIYIRTSSDFSRKIIKKNEN